MRPYNIKITKSQATVNFLEIASDLIKLVIRAEDAGVKEVAYRTPNNQKLSQGEYVPLVFEMLCTFGYICELDDTHEVLTIKKMEKNKP